MRIVAIVAAFNEADVIAHVVGDLIQQGAVVYLLDDGSTDGTAAAVEPYVGRGVLAIERLPRSDDYNWERILLRKAELARELDADWFIHHDADEFRESPWPGVTLAEAIARVDALGYNAIDFASLDFWPVNGGLAPGADVRHAYRYYSEHAPHDRVQIRCWKKAADVDLVATGGHEARFAGRNVFPIRFILRHYPIRGQAHGERKVFSERRPRFREEERARGWHVQYDTMVKGASFVREPASLQEYDRTTVSIDLALRHRGVEALEGALGEERAAIVKLRHDLDAMRQELEVRTTDLEAHRHELTARRQELERTAAAMTAMGHESDALRQQVAEHTRDLDQRQTQVAGYATELRARAEHIQLLDGQLETRRLQVEAFEAEAAAMKQLLRRRDVEIGDWTRSYDEAVRRIRGYDESWSWRLTSPLRAIGRLFARRRDS